MAFQPAGLRQFITSGLPGEIAFEGPTRAQDWTINSASGNTFGFGFTQESDGFVEPGAGPLWAMWSPCE